MKQSLPPSPVNRHAYLQLGWHQKTWEPGPPCTLLLIARKVTHFLLPRCTEQDYQELGAHCQMSTKGSALWLFQSQDCLLPPILRQQQAKCWWQFFTDFIIGKRLNNPTTYQLGCFPCIFFPTRHIPNSENTSWGRLALWWSTKSWHDLSVFPGHKWHVTSVQTRGCSVLSALAPFHWLYCDFCSACASITSNMNTTQKTSALGTTLEDVAES